MFQPDFDGHIPSLGDRLESRWEKRFQLQERDDGVKGAVHVVPDAECPLGFSIYGKHRENQEKYGKHREEDGKIKHLEK